jgi:hypothetical protein
MRIGPAAMLFRSTPAGDEAPFFYSREKFGQGRCINERRGNVSIH